MITKNLNLSRFTARSGKAAWFLSFVLAAACAFSVHAQTRGGGFGNFGGGNFGGGSRSGSSSTGSSTSTSSRDYPNNTLPGDATISIDPDSKSLVIMSDDSTFEHISNIVQRLDKPKPQVLIKVVFIEVQHDHDLDFGIEGQFTGSPASGMTQKAGSDFGLAALNTTPVGQTIGQSTMPFGTGLYSITGSDFQATVRAIASASKVEVLSRPSVMVRNNQPATITVGQSVPLVTGVSFPSTQSGPVSLITYQNVGIILQVTPFISSDGLVEMIVAPQISSLSSQSVQIATNVSAPVIDLRSASTVVVTPDGQTVVIGGLMENDKTVIDSKIPVLGDIPLLGLLFTHKQRALTKKELMIFLTPHVVLQPTQVASATLHEKSSADLTHKAFTDKQLDQYFDHLPTKPNVTTQGNILPDSAK